MSEVYHEEASEVGEADDWHWAGWILWSPSSDDDDELDKISEVWESVLHWECRWMNEDKW